MVDEAAWRCLNISLTCGQGKMKFKAMGPGASDFQLDMGNANSLHLIQVPKICGYTMRQNELGLVLVVPYDGCNVIENGEYALVGDYSKVHLPHVEKFGFCYPEACSSANETSIPSSPGA